MKSLHVLKAVFLLFYLAISCNMLAQIKPGIYFASEGAIQHELKIDNRYVILSVYEKSPAKFIKTVGGFYTLKNDALNINLEFNSEYVNDAILELNIPFKIIDQNIVLNQSSEMVFKPQETKVQDLDGHWLFATRGPDTGQERRDETTARKTLKFLLDGRFQWIAYHTETYKFSGTGGGSYTSVNGIYTENIEFFSKDDNRVGASLEFNYDLQENDWHHTGMNSKGKPMYEIWGRR